MSENENETKQVKPMTATKALDAIAKIRAKADEKVQAILAQLSDADRVRVEAFLEAA